jgi:hypothetical protein
MDFGPPVPGVEIGGSMAVAIANGDIVQVLIQGTIEGQECENVLYFRAQAADPDFLTHLLMAIAQCWVALVPLLSGTYTFERIKGKVVSPALGPEEEYIPPAGTAVQGDAAGDSEPSFVSALLSLHTTRGGRSGRGRMFLAGVPEGDTVGSLLNPETPLWPALIAFAACMLDKFKPRDVPVAGNYDWGVMSRKIGGVKPPFLSAGYAPITRVVPKRELATTRSRKLGRGR